MKRLIVLLLVAVSAFGSVAQPGPAAPGNARPDDAVFGGRIRTTIEKHLNRPYVWGACGLKSFDCSGFVWRVIYDNGVLIKRTTARKFYFSLPSMPAAQRYTPGAIVFFDDLKHCGIVADGESFYHAECSVGTNLSKFDPFWRPKACGFRAFPKSSPTPP